MGGSPLRIPPSSPVESLKRGDNPVCEPKKFLGKKMTFFQNSTLVLKWGSKSKIEFLEKIGKFGND
jgi:hypothetical protein